MTHDNPRYVKGSPERIEAERDFLLNRFRTCLRIGSSSHALITAALTGEPLHPNHHPYDQYDVEGLTDTFNGLPEWLKPDAEPYFQQQLDTYRNREARDVGAR